MLKVLVQDLRTAVVAVVAASVVAGPAAVAAVTYATNADKVDRKHAVGAGASRQTRAGKLVATNGNGYLPNNVLRKARDANRLDGLDSTAFLRANGTANDSDRLDGRDASELRVVGEVVKGPYVDMGTCQHVRILSQKLVLERPTRIFASASASYGSSSGAVVQPSIQIELVDDLGDVMANSSRDYSPASDDGVALDVAEVLLDFNGDNAYEAPAGTYTLRIDAHTYGTCGGGAGTYFSPRLSFLLIPA